MTLAFVLLFIGLTVCQAQTEDLVHTSPSEPETETYSHDQVTTTLKNSDFFVD